MRRHAAHEWHRGGIVTSGTVTLSCSVTFMAPVRIRQFLQPALEVDSRRLRGAQHELNRHHTPLLRLYPRPSVRVGDEGNLVKGQHLAVLNIDRKQAASEINGPAAPYHDTRRT